MTLHKSKVNFDDVAEVTIKGKIGGREVEYRGSIKNMDVLVEDGIAPVNSTSWSFSYAQPVKWSMNNARYSFEFDTVDGKAITAKISKKPVLHTAATHYQFVIDNHNEVRKCRAEVGAPEDATYKIDFNKKKINFEWTEYVD